MPESADFNGQRPERHTAKKDGGAEGVRTPDLLNAIQALYQLSYDPIRSDGNCKGPPRIVKTKQRNVLTFDAGTLAFSGE
jgi:hypothetical protein